MPVAGHVTLGQFTHVLQYIRACIVVRMCVESERDHHEFNTNCTVLLRNAAAVVVCALITSAALQQFNTLCNHILSQKYC
jgi:hypothetical protein